MTLSMERTKLRDVEDEEISRFKGKMRNPLKNDPDFVKLDPEIRKIVRHFDHCPVGSKGCIKWLGSDQGLVKVCIRFHEINTHTKKGLWNTPLHTTPLVPLVCR